MMMNANSASGLGGGNNSLQLMGAPGLTGSTTTSSQMALPGGGGGATGQQYILSNHSTAGSGGNNSTAASASTTVAVVSQQLSGQQQQQLSGPINPNPATTAVANPSTQPGQMQQAHAIHYVTKIRNRFSAEPDTYRWEKRERVCTFNVVDDVDDDDDRHDK